MNARAAAVLLLVFSHAFSARADGQGIVAGELRSPRFHFIYTRNSAGAAEALRSEAERERDRIAQVLGRDWTGITEVRIGRGRDELEQMAFGLPLPPPWAAAAAYPEQNVILLESVGLMEPTGPSTLRHELAHVALGQLGKSWPHWFQEGLAMYLTDESPLLARYAVLHRAIAQDRLFHFEHLSISWPSHPFEVEVAYAQSQAFVRFLSEQYGPRQFGELFDFVGNGDPFELAFAKAFHSSITVEERRWRELAGRQYTWLPILSGGTVLWGATAVVCVMAYLRRKRRLSQRLSEMEQEELRLVPDGEAGSPSADPPWSGQLPPPPTSQT